jgi:hypothetical protein
LTRLFAPEEVARINGNLGVQRLRKEKLEVVNECNIVAMIVISFGDIF